MPQTLSDNVNIPIPVLWGVICQTDIRVRFMIQSSYLAVSVHAKCKISPKPVSYLHNCIFFIASCSQRGRWLMRL